jgi:methyl-accepting chemotaxis protein
LNQAGVAFETLAEDVRKLASDIEENGRTILAGSLELRAIVCQAESGLADFEKRQETELPRIQAQAKISLEALRERRGRASDTSRGMASNYDAVRREIGELVMSLQIHDMTRQQLEHAATALGQYDEEISPRSAGLLVRLCGLQRAQLDHSKESFLAAVRSVRESLAAISRNVAGMAAESTDLLACGGGKEDSFLAEMESGFAGIRTALEEYAESRYALSKVAETVAAGVRSISEFVETIEEIGIRMQRIALNANIKAIRIGEQGSALGTVADAIQRLAADSTEQTAVVALGIREVANGSGRLSAELMQSGEDLTLELEQVIAVFHTADEENRRRLTKIGATGRAFSQELESLCAGIQADRLLTAVIEKSCRSLDEIVAAAKPLAADDAGTEPDAFRKLEEQYTMRAERSVHQQTTGEEQAVGPGTGGEWGENVELF